MLTIPTTQTTPMRYFELNLKPIIVCAAYSVYLAESLVQLSWSFPMNCIVAFLTVVAVDLHVAYIPPAPTIYDYLKPIIVCAAYSVYLAESLVPPSWSFPMNCIVVFLTVVAVDLHVAYIPAPTIYD